MHPRLRDGVTVGTLEPDDKSQEEYYFAENAQGDVIGVSRRIHEQLLHADGTHPLKLSQRSLKKLKKAGILSTGRYVFSGMWSRFIIFPIGEDVKKHKPICRLLTRLLPYAALLFFGAGVLCKLLFGGESGGDVNSLIVTPIILLSLALHEAGHFIASIAGGYSPRDSGILLLWIFPVGAYLAADENRNASPMDRVRFSLAGVEMNLLAAGLLLPASVLSPALQATLTYAANVNTLLALLNLLPADGLDGAAAISAALETDSLTEHARRFRSSRRFRRQLLRSGAAGYLSAALLILNSLCSAVLKLVMPLECILLLLYTVLIAGSLIYPPFLQAVAGWFR